MNARDAFSGNQIVKMSGAEWRVLWVSTASAVLRSIGAGGMVQVVWRRGAWRPIGARFAPDIVVEV